MNKRMPEIFTVMKGKLNILFHDPTGAYRRLEYRFYKAYCRFRGAPVPIWGEDYNLHWNYVSFKNKLVLDLGGDYGSTAFYFHRKGARQIVAVEGNHELVEKMAEYAKKFPFIVPVEKWINSSEDLVFLINQYHPDIVKVDIEGAEIYLLKCPNEVLARVNDWLIEIHDDSYAPQITRKFSSSKYKVSTLNLEKLRVLIIRRR